MAQEGNEANGTATKAKKAEVVQTKVAMKDGREVVFVGKRNINKDFGIGEGGSVWAQFDLRNGDSHRIELEPGDPMILQLAGHGLVQKGGDEAAGIKVEGTNEPDIDSMSMSIEEVLKRLSNTEAKLEDRWYAEGRAGDSFSGAAVVVKAIAEVTGKDISSVKEYLTKLLEKGKDSGLTRQKLYASFRKPGTKTAEVIERLEKEKRAGEQSAVDADAALQEMMAA